jgi:hypothetical protein
VRGSLDAADDGDVGGAVANEAEPFADGDGAGGTGHGVGGVGTGEAELDGDGAAGGADERGEGDAGIDAAQVAAVEDAGLLLGVCCAAEGGAHLHGDAIGVDACGVEGGVLEGEAGGGDGEVAEAVEAARELCVHVIGGLELVDLGGDVCAPGAGIEARDAADGRAFATQSFPELFDTGAGGGDGADAGDGDAVQLHGEWLRHLRSPAGCGATRRRHVCGAPLHARRRRGCEWR